MANGITLARTAISLALVVGALQYESWPLLLAGYLAYWIGDVADGQAARWLRQETRMGAVLDIGCDRVNSVACALALLTWLPAYWPVGIFLVQFVVVDLALSCQFLRWPLLSPNYFAAVDPLVHRLNWSPVAKATNTAALILLVVTVPDHRIAIIAALAVLAVKVTSLARTLQLPITRTARHLVAS